MNPMARVIAGPSTGPETSVSVLLPGAIWKVRAAGIACEFRVRKTATAVRRYPG